MREIADLGIDEMQRGLLDPFLLALYLAETPTELVHMVRKGAELAVQAPNETAQIFDLQNLASVAKRITLLYPTVDKFVAAATDASDPQKAMYAKLYNRVSSQLEDKK